MSHIRFKCAVPSCPRDASGGRAVCRPHLLTEVALMALAGLLAAWGIAWAALRVIG